MRGSRDCFSALISSALKVGRFAEMKALCQSQCVGTLINLFQHLTKIESLQRPSLSPNSPEAKRLLSTGQ